MYTSRTHNVTVSVEPVYLERESAPEKNQYFWAYTVKIKNDGDETLQLRTRYWKITDAYGRVQEVHGAGVVGEEPVLPPGKSFEYTSGTPLSTPVGFMSGTYSMQKTDGALIDVAIPVFSLDTPDATKKVN